MNAISELKVILKQQLNWHKSRIDFFAQALLGLFICRTINFREIAVSMPSETEIYSCYKRQYGCMHWTKKIQNIRSIIFISEAVSTAGFWYESASIWSISLFGWE